MARKATKGSEDVVIWIRVPRGISIDKIKKLELDKLPASVCHGGDTCICAPVFTKSAGIVIQGPKGLNIQELLKRAGFNPEVKCFGGDTCIV